MLLMRSGGRHLSRRIVRPFTAALLGMCVLTALLELATFSPPSAAAGRASLAAPSGCSDIRLFWHRGDRYSGHTENSRTALRLSVAKGFGLETDLRTTKDGRIILMHDDTVNRTTSGRGHVENLTAAQIRKHRLDDGSKVPYLAAALQILTNHDGSRGMLELKPHAMPRSSLRKLWSHIDDKHLRHRVIVYSYDRHELKRFRRMSHGVATSLIPHGDETDWSADDFVPYGGVTIRSADVSSGLSRRARKIGLDVIAWQAAGPRAWRANVESGTYGLILNHPNRYQHWCEK
jgi:glycerophosphoryl diester phosphodiesterase